MKQILLSIAIILAVLGFFSCNNEDSQEPMLIVKFKFDPNQARLNNIGAPALVPSGNSAQTPVFNSISSHYIELAPDQYTQLGQGIVLYHAPETTLGGANAIDFSKAKIVSEGETFLKIPLRQIAAGDYRWVRCSLSYQNYGINVRHNGVDYPGTLASFVGFNTYIGTHSIGNSFFPINGNRAQGYWAFALDGSGYSTDGQAPAGATTVPNPIAATSPIPAGSCVVTGCFADDLVITGNESHDITVTLSLSINHSFEWHEVNADGKYEPGAGENVVDMGLRGLIPSFQ
ncbi:MAG: hypothetical protein EOO48_02510 [Flavobacterium sp.]|nr:MAG: hypothetical protein EOO48_02510 [Flavobacterium sp.]